MLTFVISLSYKTKQLRIKERDFVSLSFLFHFLFYSDYKLKTSY